MINKTYAQRANKKTQKGHDMDDLINPENPAASDVAKAAELLEQRKTALVVAYDKLRQAQKDFTECEALLNDADAFYSKAATRFRDIMTGGVK